MFPSKKTLLLSLLPVFALAACDEAPLALNYDIYRAAPGETDLEFEGGVCIRLDDGGSVGGGSNEYTMRQEPLPGGGAELTYLVLDPTPGPEHPIEDDNEDLIEVAVVSLEQEELASGEIFMVEFDRPDGAHFEVVHWGSEDCDGPRKPAP